MNLELDALSENDFKIENAFLQVLSNIIKSHEENSDPLASNGGSNGVPIGSQAHDFVNQRKVSNDDSLVQIYIPPNNNTEESDDDTLSVDSQAPHDVVLGSNLNEDQPSNVTKKTEVKRTLSAEVASRKIPPMLSDWQTRSQSFPPPKGPNSSTSEAAFSSSEGLQELQEKSGTESSLSVKSNDHDGNLMFHSQCTIISNERKSPSR